MTALMVVLVWAAALLAAAPYVAAVRHPGLKPIEAYLLFVVVFSAICLPAFGLAVLAIGVFSDGTLEGFAPAITSGAFAFSAALLAATILIRQPPRQSGEPHWDG